jgi:hypothetical protein
MINKNWQDIYDETTDTHMRVAPEVLQMFGQDNVLKIALHLKARNPLAAPKGGILAQGHNYTANGVPLVLTVILLKGEGGQVPVFLIDTKEHWAEWCEGREERN